MKADVDRLMAEADLDALWITGSSGGNPPLDYFVGQAHLEGVHVVKKVGQPPVLLHRMLEREEARDTGLRTVSLNQGRLHELLEQTEGDRQKAYTLQLAEQFEELGLAGRVAIYGHVEAGQLLNLLESFKQLLPDVEWLPDHGSRGVLSQARMTKEPEEVERIRRMGKVTVEVVDAIRSQLGALQMEGNRLLDEGGRPLTVGAVKDRIHFLLAERRAASPIGPIFAQGREGAIGHSVGRDKDEIRPGRTIIFDIYPRELGGGYFYDFTRTWCLGEVPDEVQELHADVKQVYDSVFALLEAGASTRELQNETCRLFEGLGHPTVRSAPDSESGYIHGLAHGVGLDIHEPPNFRHYPSPEETTLRPGMVFSFEPGLYYPDRDMGVRLEDTVYVRSDGTIERLAEYPYDLNLPAQLA